MRRSLHGLLWLKNYIETAIDDTVILVGDEESNRIIFPLCLRVARDTGVVFWVPFPGHSLGASVQKFNALVIDTSWNIPLLSQWEKDWAEDYVLPHINSLGKLHNVPA